MNAVLKPLHTSDYAIADLSLADEAARLATFLGVAPP